MESAAIDKTLGERGFTLIELLVVALLVVVLSSLAMTAYDVYKSNAAYGSIEVGLRNARNAAEASQTDPDHLPPGVNWAFQNTQGIMTNPSAAQYLPGFRLSAKSMLVAYYNPDCAGAWCLTDYIQIQHCQAKEYAAWARWGDGWETTISHLPFGGGGC